MKSICICNKKTGALLPLLLMAFLCYSLPAFAAEHETKAAIPPDEVVQKLKDGNKRFMDGKQEFPHQNQARVQELVAGQTPYVAIVSCSDSRVVPEDMFDVGLGDLFIIRVAGNVCNKDEIASVEYATEHLNTPLVVVMGHTKCGAVTAAVSGAKAAGNLPALLDSIKPAVTEAKKLHPELSGNDLVPEAVKANVWQGIENLFAKSEIVRELAKEGKIKVVGAIYHIEGGKVEWLGEHPKHHQLFTHEAKADEGKKN